MATLRRCGNNHVYDADLYATCPYCTGQGTSIQFDTAPSGNTSAPGYYAGSDDQSVPPSGMNPTVAPGMNHTIAPGMNQSAAPVAGNGGYSPAAHGQNPEDMGKTIAPKSYVERQQREGRTIGAFSNRYSLDPVVGWVVCVEGADQGRSYELYARINLIGRGERADVRLLDMTISKEQVKLSYDTKHNQFYLIPGDSTNPTYLNDTPLYIPTPIKAYDLVEVGESKLMFIPFCSDQFSWSSVIKQGE